MYNQKNIIIGIVVVLVAIAGIILVMRPRDGGDLDGEVPPPDVYTIILYTDEISSSEYGFGFLSENITSPGPKLRLFRDQETNITIINIGEQPHAFAITDSLSEDAAVLFESSIGSVEDPVMPDETRSTLFTPESTGDYFYICPIPGHIEAGMWGNTTITSPNDS